MSEKKYAGAPFGIQTARFDVSGVHPKNKMPGTFTQTAYSRTTNENTMLGPGRYEVTIGGFTRKAVAERASGPGWARSYEVAQMAALPHLLHKEQWEAKRALEKKMGPGIYEFRDFVQVAEEKPRSTRGIIQTREARFKDKHPSETPGPGTYGKGGVPHALLEEKEKESFSQVGMLNSGASLSRSLPSVGSHLGPGTYKHESIMDALGKKVTGLRGPYDTFTGDRNKPIRTGHLAAPAPTNMVPGQYDLKSFTDEWTSEHKQRLGKFGKVAQYPENPTERIFCELLSQKPRPIHEPSPGTYDGVPLKNPLTQARKWPPFMSSAQRSDRMSTKNFTGNYNPVGPGRYDIQIYDKAQHKNGHKFLYKSKTQKPDQKRETFLQQRIRAKDVRPEDKVFMVTPEAFSSAMDRTNKYRAAKGMEQTHFAARRAATVI